MKDSILIQLGQHVRLLRQKHGLTQEQLAIKSRISLKYIQKIEGKTPSDIGLETLEKLAHGLNTPLWKLIKFD